MKLTWKKNERGYWSCGVAEILTDDRGNPWRVDYYIGGERQEFDDPDYWGGTIKSAKKFVLEQALEDYKALSLALSPRE